MFDENRRKIHQILRDRKEVLRDAFISTYPQFKIPDIIEPKKTPIYKRILYILAVLGMGILILSWWR